MFEFGLWTPHILIAWGIFVGGLIFMATISLMAWKRETNTHRKLKHRDRTKT